MVVDAGAGHGRNAEIECLRALAVLGVMVHHMQGNLWSPSLQGFDTMTAFADFWWGVDLFFAISGFVIARSFLPVLASSDNLARDWPGLLGGFWIRRFWRLVPSAWLWLGLVLLAVVGFNHSKVFGSLHANLMATLVGVLNVANFRFADAFFRYEYGASFVYWSLSLEEQFYLLFPLLALLFRRHLAWLMLALFMVQFCLFRTPLLMVVRTDAIALGVLLALAEPSALYRRVEPVFLKTRPVLAACVALVLLCGMSWLCSSAPQGWRYRISALALLAGGLVWLSSYDAGYVMPRSWLRRGLAWVGARSYAIYLIHVPAFFFLRECFYRLIAAGWISSPPAWWLLVGLAMGLVALLAELNNRYVEQPLRRHGRSVAAKFERRRIGGHHASESPSTFSSFAGQ